MNVSKFVDLNKSLLQPSIIENTERLSVEENLHFELAKIIKRYEQCSGWTMLIAPEGLPNKQVMQEYQVKLDKVLTIPKKDCTNELATAYQALKFDNCSALVIWDNDLSTTEIKLLLQKARASHTSLYFLRHNNQDHVASTH